MNELQVSILRGLADRDYTMGGIQFELAIDRIWSEVKDAVSDLTAKGYLVQSNWEEYASSSDAAIYVIQAVGRAFLAGLSAQIVVLSYDDFIQALRSLYLEVGTEIHTDFAVVVPLHPRFSGAMAVIELTNMKVINDYEGTEELMDVVETLGKKCVEHGGELGQMIDALLRRGIYGT